MTRKLFVHNHGYVELLDQMPKTGGDQRIVDSARVSYAEGTKHTSSSEGLIRYLMRHWHTSPFEMVEFMFRIKMPLFVARQHLRHRTANVNETSARYSVVTDEFFVPGQLREQAAVNKQGSGGEVEDSDDIVSTIQVANDAAHDHYNNLLEAGVCREQARMVLPQTMYTEFVWKIDLHNLMHFLRLRMDSHAQEEIRDYANAMFKLVEPTVPYTMKAFKDFRLNAVQFSGPEVKLLKQMISVQEDIPGGELSKGEAREFKDKVRNLLNA